MRIADHEDGHSQEWPLVFAYFGLGCESVAHIAGSNLLCLWAEAITIVDCYNYPSSPCTFYTTGHTDTLLISCGVGADTNLHDRLS
jgi:hypothetical protein